MKKLLLLPLLFLTIPSTGRAGLPPDYSALKAAQKQTLLWNRVVATEYTTLPTEDSLLPNGKLLDAVYLLPSFLHTSDELPRGRKKLIHAYGSVAKVELRISDSRYSGIFHSGGIGLARLSIARMINAKTAFTPGMAVKIFVDGDIPSVNFHVMNGVDGQGTDRFFFAKDFSNILPKPTSAAGKVISASFEAAVHLLNFYYGLSIPSAGDLPLNDACSVNSDSTPVEDPAVACPAQIIFHPNDKITAASFTSDDFRDDLARLPSGTVLYDVAVKATPESPEENVGQLVTQSRFVASSFGDKKLFFQHAN